MKDIELLKQAVFTKQKVLAEIYNDNQNTSLFNYVNSWEVSNSKIEPKVLNIIQALLENIHDLNTVKQVITQLQNSPLVSTIDHHGLLNHPFFLNSNLIFSLRKNIKYLICFTTSGVSLNNSSWPGSLVFSKANGSLGRVSFFSDKQKMQTVFAASAINRVNIEKINLQIEKSVLNSDQKSALTSLIAKITNEKIFSFKNFSEQASLLSSRLWQELFPSAPEIIYLPVEDLVSKVLVELIIADEKHILHQLVFSERGNNLIEKYFNGLKGAFDTKGYGSFLFWNVDEKGKRVALNRKDFKLSAEIISQSLEQRQMYPTSLLCFLVMLYYGITCIGGFNQVNWLTEVKEKFSMLLKEFVGMGFKPIPTGNINALVTKNFAEGNLAFLYLENKLIKATGIDVFLWEDKNLYEKYSKLSQQITVGESIESLLPEIYRVITPDEHRDNNILDITDYDIAKQNGMEQKIKATNSRI